MAASQFELGKLHSLAMAACNPLMVKGKLDYLFARIKSVLPCSSSMEDPIDSPIAKTILAPANTAEASEGGEWQELMAVLNNWLGAGKASQIWEQSQGPLKAAGLAIVILILLQLLGAVLGTLNHIPMLPRLLELVGLIWLGIFAAKKLVRSSDRKTFIGQLSGAWNSFSGRP
ncbi:MAG: hypothetical protein EBV08_02510 [Synechococcaceae bacterium WB6_1B_055]|nr:hypothetical protein [Synechococcaceae bacterium WB6_1B_055]NDA74705.1 hypothetical protein [Synechococcaceae bacterium WB8_3_299]NDD20641.1 hypothetical protein [Synechococcaceae bacterium WBA_3_309]NDE21591.1 hypothetical protein [Synechococcaceae bacterium WB9_3_282]NDG01380.1 hypothetical protein [Synechococcaceae bacterium WBB_32_011]